MIRICTYKNVHAYTMIELMIVVSIVAVLAMIALPTYVNYQSKAQATQAVADINAISKAIDLYRSAMGRYPDSLADVYMDDMRDPWGNPYQYLPHATQVGGGNSNNGGGNSNNGGGNSNNGGGNSNNGGGNSNNGGGNSNAGGGNSNAGGGNSNAGGGNSNAGGVGQYRKDRNLVPINSDYDLYSMGPDERSVGPLTAKASHDDIIRAGNGSYVGVAEDY